MIGVERDDDVLFVVVESTPGLTGCPACGVVAVSKGRRVVELIDAPAFGSPVRLRWRKRRWVCPDPGCEVGSFTEQDAQVAAPRAVLTSRATRWATAQLRSENASVAGLARQLGVSWWTVWNAIRPALAADESRFDGVTTLGVDEHVWHHVSPKDRGPKELTGMVDLTRDDQGRTRARLLDLVPGRSGTVYRAWLDARGEDFRDRVQIATLDPFHGYKNAIDDQLQDATAVLDAFHVVKLAGQAIDEVRRRVQQATLGHRGRAGDPLYGIRNILRAAPERLTDRQVNRLNRAIAADDAHDEVLVAWQAAQQIRTAYRLKDLTQGRRLAERVLASLPSCPIPEIARLGRTLRKWRTAFLAYFTTDRSSNGGTEAVNGLIELARRIARGFRNRDNYRLRMLLVAGGLTP
ncbi:transposase [Isoptericola jiangsuensis]|uniref:Transposase n=1 Tax=Isoptericola jiangsuensis TaxID=548579 RepID=A0A2A9EYT4_9MICO|nr:ISL3 family transposase [Isoptericola jiangsuensis]PFG43375.1 transposase [Isoptericola jiangsuensis]